MMVSNLIRSVHLFSKYPIIVYAVGVEELYVEGWGGRCSVVSTYCIYPERRIYLLMCAIPMTRNNEGLLIGTQKCSQG